MIDWLRRLVMWDGILPLAVWATPRAAQWLLPGERWPIEVPGVTLPIDAFIALFLPGWRSSAASSHARYSTR